MVAERTPPNTIDLAELDGPLADALRDAARADRTVQVTDGGRPLARITPIRPVELPAVSTAETPPNAPERSDDELRIEEGRRQLAEASAKRRAMTEPYVFDPVEHEKVMSRRNRLREEFAKLNLPAFSAVDWVREQRRDD